MADKKISQLTGGGAAQATDEYVIARSGNNFKVTGANVAAAATSVGTLTSLTVSGNATFDTSTLFVDAANNRVGMGIASSLASVLHIKGPAGSNPATGGIVFQYSTNSSNYGAIGLDNASGSFAVLAGSGAELRFHTNSDLATTNLRWRIGTTGHLVAGADNTYDIGASGANRPRSVYVGTSVVAGNVQVTVASAFLSNTSQALVGYADSHPAVANGGLILQSRSSTARPIVFVTGATTGTIRAFVPDNGGFVVGESTALATNATDGFLYVPTCAGTPTGTPTGRGATAAVVVDTTNHKLYFYSGGSWRDAGP
jgi:hypothetical protein